VNTDPGPSGIKVGFFVGCLIDKMFPSIGEAVLDVLKYHGVGVLLPEGEGCCGIPAISLGDMSTFKRLVIHNLERFEANTFDYLVTACATCTSTIKKVWPTMAHEFSDDVRQRIKKISEKAMDINQFLVSKVGFEKGESGETDNPTLVTYHDPCHLKKSLGVAGAPRAIIRANPRYRFKEMAESDWCCGSGGSFNIEYYEISASIGRRKRDNILASGCSVLATGCPACMIQICDMLSQAGASIEVKHPVEIYAEGLSKGPSLRPSAS
nr:(Fe-S)-binding protein [Desulfobacterales bacterium]